MTYRKKLIEVALPLEAINKASAREKSIRHGHPSTLHLWWARRPLAAARAVIFSQMVDDPSGHPDRFPTEEDQEKERQRLFRLIEQLVLWENTTNEEVLQQAREEIWKSWRATCSDNKKHPRASELFDPKKLPAFHDPFAGGGSLPLEAQRLGLESYASDLNPVAVLINKAMIEIPPRFAGKPPVNPESRKNLDMTVWKGAQGLAEDVRYYGKWMRDEAEKRIGHLYPKVEVTAEMAKARPDLKPYVGRKLTVIAWLWARTVKSPNPAFAKVDVPLASTFMLSTKAGKEVYVKPVIENGGYRFTVKVGKPKDAEAAKNGTKLSRGANFQCLMSGTPIAGDYIKAEGNAGRMGARLMAIVAEGDRGRVYLAPAPEHEAAALRAKPEWKPEVEFFQQALGFRVGNYGMTKWSDLFTDRQLVALTTFSDLVQEARERVQRDALAAAIPDDKKRLPDEGTGAAAYGDAVGVYLAISVSRAADYWGTGAIWEAGGSFIAHVFTRNALPMTWDYPEGNPFCDGSGNWNATCLEWVERYLKTVAPAERGIARQADAQTQSISEGAVVSTDPPYYDNIGYADLSDYFYVWLRRSLRPVFPDLFATVAVPKAEELVATPARHGGREQAETFFLAGMTLAMHRLGQQAHPAFPVTIYYAFKQAESEGDTGRSSTGWETFLDAVIQAGFSTTGTWPMRTERPGRIRETGSNALASSIVLVCRQRDSTASMATRREFLKALKDELPLALKTLQHANIAPVDLAQATIGPGMAIYTRYAKVLEADGTAMPVRTALVLINQILDEFLAEQEGEMDSDSRFCLSWFEQYGMKDGPFGEADVLARAKNTSVDGIVRSGCLSSKAGKVRLLTREEMPAEYDPATDERHTVWECAQHLIKVLDAKGEAGAASFMARLGPDYADQAKALAYRLFAICERKGWAEEALAYNRLITSWGDVQTAAASAARVQYRQTGFDEI